MNLYYSRLKKLWHELENYTQFPSTANNFDILIIITKEREKEKIYQFSIGLNDAIFGTVHLNII